MICLASSPGDSEFRHSEGGTEVARGTAEPKKERTPQVNGGKLLRENVALI
jgi:hypothetical protein